MAGQGEIATGERLLALWDHLGLAAAHVATQVPADIAGLATAHPDRVAGIVLCTASRLDPAPFAPLADRLLLIAGDRGLTAEAARRAAARLPAAERTPLADYGPQSWSDVAADRTAAVAEAMIGFLTRHAGRVRASEPAVSGMLEGRHAGITYRIAGAGPALVLFPFFLAPSQWLPLIPPLSARFTTITLGGPHLGGVAALEDRARAPTYRALFRTLIDLLAPMPGEAILEIGCGAGSLARLLAERLKGANPIAAVDVNPFLLREAAALSATAGLQGAIGFGEGNAEALPFADASFDCVYSVTALEECDADRAIAEALRVTRPGGRVGIVVRAIDMPQWWNLALPEAIARKVATPPQSVSAAGVADASLYRRLAAAGLIDLTCFPALVTLDRPDGAMWRYREDHALSLLSAEETAAWQAARASAAAAGLLFAAHGMHCAVGRKPGAAKQGTLRQ